jgi:PEP-CTERM motif
MKRKFFLFTGMTVVCLALAPATFAQTVNGDEPDNSMLYLPNVDLTSLNQNDFTGIVGGQFLTPYYYNVSVNYLGYADPNDVALVDSHTVTLWDGGGNVVASAVVPAGTPTLWANGYDWVQLGSTVTLTYNSYYEVGATVVGGVDSWGDLISNNSPDNGNNGQITWNVENGSWSGDANGPFVQAGSGYEFSRVGEYDSNTGDAGNPNPSLNQTSAQDSIYPAANLGYNVVSVPEPTALGLLGMGTIALFRFTRRQKD